MTFPQAILVSDQAGLHNCVEVCLQASAIAVDTEFVRTDTFYPILGLIQITDGNNVWLIDPLGIDDYSDLVSLFTEQNVVKVFHSCSEDLDVISHYLDVLPSPIFDTQVASAFVGIGFSRGYSYLVNHLLGIELGKHETRSDWLQRPLSEAQCRYAAEDVYYLIRAYQELLTLIEVKHLSAWVGEDMNRLLEGAGSLSNYEDYYLRVKGAWRLSGQDLYTLKQLVVWREAEARRRNRPRNRVVPDNVLLELIAFKPRSVNGLYSVEGVHRGVIQRYGVKLVEICHSGAGEQLPVIEGPLDKKGKTLLAKCRKLIDDEVSVKGIATEIIAKKKELEELVRSILSGKPHLPEKLASGWRYDLLGEKLLEMMNESARRKE